jgi:hypothetical protein
LTTPGAGLAHPDSRITATLRILRAVDEDALDIGIAEGPVIKTP